MVRVTNALSAHRRRKRLRKAAKGFWGDRRDHLRQTGDAVMKAMSYSTKHRRKRKSEMRNLWVTRIGVAAKINGISYNKLIFGLKKAGSLLNRKMLADLAVRDPDGFSAVAAQAKSALV